MIGTWKKKKKTQETREINHFYQLIVSFIFISCGFNRSVVIIKRKKKKTEGKVKSVIEYED